MPEKDRKKQLSLYGTEGNIQVNQTLLQSMYWDTADQICYSTSLSVVRLKLFGPTASEIHFRSLKVSETFP